MLQGFESWVDCGYLSDQVTDGSPYAKPDNLQYLGPYLPTSGGYRLIAKHMHVRTVDSDVVKLDDFVFMTISECYRVSILSEAPPKFFSFNFSSRSFTN